MVSALIVTRNRSGLLREAIRSVELQAYKPLELVVVDDASDDDTALLLADLAERTAGWLRHVTLTSRRGVAGALNAGIAIASGELIAFLGDDDTWESTKLSSQVRMFRGDVDLAFTSIVRESDGASELVRIPDWRSERDEVVELLLQGCAIVGSTVVIRRSVFNRVGLFDERLVTCEDWDMWIRVALMGQGIAYLDEPLTRYRFHPGSLSRNATIVNESAALMFSKVFSSAALPLRFTRRKAFYLARARLNAASRSLAARDGPAARRELLRAARVHPPSIRLGWLGIYARSLLTGQPSDQS